MAERKRGGHAPHPHDALIKRTFSRREHAAGLIKAALAPEIVALIRWPTLEMEKIHFVDRGLRGRYADLLFSVEIGDERAYVYVLIEHQSTVDSLMAFRMGSYMWRHWEQLVRDEPARRTLPVIIPILLHHSDSGWTAATRFEQIVNAPDAVRASLLPYIPRFGMKLVDVSRGTEASGLAREALTDLGRVVLWCLSVARDERRLFSEIDQLVPELNALYAAPPDIDALRTLLGYLAGAHPRLGVAKIAKLLETTARKGRKEIAMDALEEWEEARRREGELSGRARTLLELLTARFGAVPAKAKARVRAADERTLSRWAIRVLTAPTLDDVLSDAPAAKPAKARPAAPARRAPARKRARTAKK